MIYFSLCLSGGSASLALVDVHEKLPSGIL